MTLRLDAPVGIIDIGSNSLRLVVYGAHPQAAAPVYVFEDKAICQLARGVDKNGNLSEVRIASALDALTRFKEKLAVLNITHIEAIATSAVRSATNSDAFVQPAEAILGVPVHVISGDEEARLSALGVVFSFPNAKGVVADLGGGSLELAELTEKTVGQTVSFTLGHQRLLDLWEASDSFKPATKQIKADLSAVNWFSDHQGDTLYLVGSVFRQLGKLYLASIDQPAQPVHGLAIKKGALKPFLKMLTPPVFQTEWVDNVRDELKMVVGALILKQLIEQQKPKTVVISITGIREGLLLN